MAVRDAPFTQDAIPIMKSQFRHLALYCLFIVCACLCSSAVFAAVTNQASISYADPKTGTATKPSNEVKTLLSETISYYTSSSYEAVARVARSG